MARNDKLGQDCYTDLYGVLAKYAGNRDDTFTGSLASKLISVSVAEGDVETIKDEGMMMIDGIHNDSFKQEFLNVVNKYIEILEG